MHRYVIQRYVIQRYVIHGYYLSALGTARANANQGGVLLDKARDDKERKYNELTNWYAAGDVH